MPHLLHFVIKLLFNLFKTEYKKNQSQFIRQSSIDLQTIFNLFLETTRYAQASKDPIEYQKHQSYLVTILNDIKKLYTQDLRKVDLINQTIFDIQQHQISVKASQQLINQLLVSN